MKARLGAMAYVVSGVRASRRLPLLTTVSVDGAVQLVREAHGVTVGNCGALAGGMSLMPTADPTDGLLDGVAFLQRSLVDWARVAWSVVSRRDHPNLPQFRGQVIDISTDKPQAVEVDGDVVGEASRVRFRVQAGALLVRCPK